MTAAAIELDYLADLSSYVTVRHSRKSYQLTPRSPEIAAYDRRAYGGRQLATDRIAPVATAKNDALHCSDCKEDKHFEQFPLSSIFLHRHAIWIEEKKNGKKVGKLFGRGYQCNACKHIRYEEAKAAALHLALLEKGQGRKPVKQSKKAKKKSKKKQIR